jgi:hypothetical protein
MAFPNQLPAGLEMQLKEQRRVVDFDTFDIHVQQLVSMLKSNQITIAPSYQRKFRWNQKQCSQLIESIMLGIPIPSMFMATNKDNTWEVVDGVQRLSTIIKFVGDAELRHKLGLNGQLVLTELDKLDKFVGLTFDQLPQPLQLHFMTRPAKVITLNDKSDPKVRFDLFERLNTGGVALSPQEIRDCVFAGTFAEKLEFWAKDPNFRTAVKLTPLQQRDATAEDCVLRFFAFRHWYKKFVHDVTKFLNLYMEEAAQNFDYADGDKVFTRTFKELARVFPDGIKRFKGKNTTPLNLYEGVAVGASLALDHVPRLSTAGIDKWMASPELKKFTTGATNSLSMVKGRIEFCRDRFLGKPYVSDTSA